MVSGAIIIRTKDGPVQYNTIHYTEIESQCMHCQTVEELSTPLMVSATHCRYEVIRVDVVPVSESHVLKPMGLRTGPSGWLPACLYVIQTYQYKPSSMPSYNLRFMAASFVLFCFVTIHQKSFSSSSPQTYIHRY